MLVISSLLSHSFSAFPALLCAVRGRLLNTAFLGLSGQLTALWFSWWESLEGDPEAGGRTSQSIYSLSLWFRWVQVTSEVLILFSMPPVPWQTCPPWCQLPLGGLTVLLLFAGSPHCLSWAPVVAPCSGTDQALSPYAVRLFTSPNALILILNPSYKLPNLGSNILPGHWPMQCLSKIGHAHFWCLMPRNRKCWLTNYKIIFMEEHSFFSVNLYIY